MQNLVIDLQRLILVRSLTDARPFIFSQFIAGETYQYSIIGATPTGIAGAPYTAVTLTAATLSLTYSVDGTLVSLANSSAFSPVGNTLQGSLTLIPSIVAPSNLEAVEASFDANVVWPNEQAYIPTRAAVRNSAFVITPPTGGGYSAGTFPLTIFSVGDGAASSLEALPTIGLAPPRITYVSISATGQTQIWTLAASTAANVAGNIQRPNDFNASTNPKVWFFVFSN